MKTRTEHRLSRKSFVPLPSHARHLAWLGAVALLLGLISSAQAGKRRRVPPSTPVAVDELNSSGTAPSEQLAPYIQHIDQLLALERRPESAAVLDQAQGRLAILKHAFMQRKVTADAPERARLDAAIATCDWITAALDERMQTLNQINASLAVRGSDDLGERRKDTLTDGVEGRRKGRAAKIEWKREKREALESRREALERDDSMTARATQRWNQRAIQLRKQITEPYAHIPSG